MGQACGVIILVVIALVVVLVVVAEWRLGTASTDAGCPYNWWPPLYPVLPVAAVTPPWWWEAPAAAGPPGCRGPLHLRTEET